MFEPFRVLKRAVKRRLKLAALETRRIIWQKRHAHLTPKVGDLAPDFELRDVNGRNTVRLSDFGGRRPVALVFGSLR